MTTRFAASALGMVLLLACAGAPGRAETRPAATDTKADPKGVKPPMDLVNAKLAADFDPQAAILKANAWFNGAETMVGDFVQVGPDGRRSEGKLYVQRPGRMRFEYAQPATLEIIADGTSVVLRDRKLGTQDNYFLAQTPLKFLLKDKIDLSRDVKVLDVSGDPRTTSIFVEDKATFGGTSRIKLMFDAKTYMLKQWQVTDPQGYETLVSLFNVELDKKPDPNLFKITQERFLNPN